MENQQQFRTQAERLRHSLENLSLDLRRGLLDQSLELLLSFHQRHLCIKNVLGFVAKSQAGKVARLGDFWDCSVEYESTGGANVSYSNETPNFGIIIGLAQCNAENQMLAYLSRYLKLFPELIASAYESLEMTRFHHCIDCSQRRPRSRSRLESFRMAQKIRNEFGCERQDSPSTCFSSFEDIIRLEEQIAEGDSADFLLQCIKLELVDDRHVDQMYRTFSKHSHLAKFQDAVSALEGPERHLYTMAYCRRFMKLENSTPTWSEVAKFLERFSFNMLDGSEIDRSVGQLFGFEIPGGELGKAFILLTNSYLRSFNEHPPRSAPFRAGSARIRSHGTGTIVTALKYLLDKGVSLYCRGEVESLRRELSVVAILIELARTIPGFPFSDFVPYICCPLMMGGCKVEFDRTRPAPLFCLAARDPGVLDRDSGIPMKLRLWIKMHQEVANMIRGSV